MASSKKIIKRTVAIHPEIDAYVRLTWRLMIENNVHDPTYSAALNFMLLGAISEGQKAKGWTRTTREKAWDFATDRETLEQLKLHESLPLFKGAIEKQELQDE